MHDVPYVLCIAYGHVQCNDYYHTDSQSKLFWNNPEQKLETEMGLVHYLYHGELFME